MAATVIEQYSWNVSVTKTGSPVSGAAVIGFNTSDTLIIDTTTNASGVLAADINVESDSHSVAAFVTTTTTRNPYDLRVVNYGDIPVYFGKNFTVESTDSVFLVTDTVITEATKATVAAYTGYAETATTITLSTGTWNPQRLYDRAQVENEDNPVAARFAAIESVDGVNYQQGSVVITNQVAFDANGASYDGTWILSGASGTFTDGTIDTLRLTALTPTTLTDVTATTEVQIERSNVTYTFNTCDIAAVDTQGAQTNITINLVDNAQTPTNNDPTNITINNAVQVVVNGLFEGTAVVVQSDETAGTVTKGDILGQGLADSTGAFSFSINYEGAFGAGLDVLVRARNQGLATAAIAEDNGTGFTDETEESNTAALNDMTLVPVAPAVNDAYYFGHPTQFSRLKVDVSTAGSGLTITWEYWNGAWVSLSGVSDATSNWSNTGTNTVSWTLPTDWATQTVNSQGPYFYVRARVSAVSTPTQALGRTATLDVTRYLPVPPTGVLQRTITSTGLTVTLNQTVDSISTF